MVYELCDSERMILEWQIIHLSVFCDKVDKDSAKGKVKCFST